jgi:hypothetical protein
MGKGSELCINFIIKNSKLRAIYYFYGYPISDALEVICYFLRGRARGLASAVLVCVGTHLKNKVRGYRKPFCNFVFATFEKQLVITLLVGYNNQVLIEPLKGIE